MRLNISNFLTREKNLLLVIVLSVLPLISIFATPLLFHSHDGLVHLARIGAYYKALSDGQIPVRWAGDLNYGYGMPLFIFIYPLPYFVSSVFLFLGFGLVSAFKITLGLSYILSGLFMFTFAKEFFNDERKTLLVTIFYQFAPFRLVEILARGAFGEVYTYTFLPAVLFGLTHLFKKIEYRSFSYTVIATALLILSHNSISLVFFAICTGFVIFFARSKKNFLLGSGALLLGLFLAAFYWVPAIAEHKYTYGDLFMKNVYLSNFPHFANLFIPNFTNDVRLLAGKVPVQIGLFHVFAIIASIMLLILRKKVDSERKRLIAFSLLIVVISLFFTQPISKPFWANVGILRQFQFPWRFLSLMAFSTSLLSVSLLGFNFFKKKWVYPLLLFLVIASTIFYWKPPEGYDKINEQYYWNYPLNTTYYGETDVIWSAGPAKASPKQRVEIISGEGEVSGFTKKSNRHSFSVDAKTDAVLVDHTQYFPGWRTYVDGRVTPIQFQDPNWRGEIEFTVLRGAHSIIVKFGESKVRLLGDLLSAGGVFLLLMLWVFSLRLRKNVHK